MTFAGERLGCYYHPSPPALVVGGSRVRIRQVRPEFWTDPVTARLTPPAMLTYIGLWGVADDAGWLPWNVEQIGALLYPYKSGHVRTRMVTTAGDQLVEAGRMVLHPCGCAHIPTLEAHQRIGGNKSFTARDKHRVHTSMDKSARNVTLGNVTVGNGIPDAIALRNEEDRLEAQLRRVR